MIDGLNPIGKNDLRPMRDIAYQHLRDAILSNALKRGDRLIETSIAEQMHTSRTPVREALSRLQSEGLVEYVPRKGIVVTGISCEDAVEIYDIREVLDGLAVRLACKRFQPKEITVLKELIDAMENAIERESFQEIILLHNEFNEKILSVAKSKVLTHMSRNLTDYLASFRAITLKRSNRPMEAVAEHREIVAAIEKGLVDEGEALARRHVQQAKKVFLKEACVENLLLMEETYVEKKLP